MFKILINKITIISLISNEGERSYRITFVDFIISVILIYFALQMYDTITMFLASDINVYIEDKVVVKSLTYTMTTLLISTVCNTRKAQQELTKMYESLDKDSDLYKFLTKHCKYLLLPLEGNCPICLNLEMPNKIFAL